MPSIITCIYCKKEQPRSRRGEHIVHDGLGGRVCIRSVCTSCNTGVLQRLDEEFLRNSPVAYMRVLFSTRGELRSPQFVPSDEVGGWLDCVVRAPRDVQVVPQLVVRDGQLATLVCKGDNDGARAALVQLAELGVGALHVDVNQRPENVPTRLALRPREKKNAYAFTLRAQSQVDADTFLSIYLKQGAELAHPLAWKDVDLQLGAAPARTEWDVNVPGRCAAKMAFNLFAHYFGPDIALRNEFDRVRNYIRGDDVLPVEEVTGPDGEVGVTIDRRFVGPWYDMPPTKHWSCLDGHTLILNCQRRVVQALVHLFSGRMTFAVELGQLGTDVVFAKSLPLFFFTPADGTGDQELGLYDVIARAPLSP